MNVDLTITVGLVTSLIGLIGSVWKVQKIIDGIEDSIRETEYKIDKRLDEVEHNMDITTMTANGYRDQIKHNAEKLQGLIDKTNARIDDTNSTLYDLENFIAKTTVYERRARR